SPGYRRRRGSAPAAPSVAPTAAAGWRRPILGRVIIITALGRIAFAPPMAQRHHAAKKPAAAQGGIAKPFFARRHVGHHAAPRSDHRPLADPHIVREPNLAGQGDTVLDYDAPGDAALPDDDAMA